MRTVDRRTINIKLKDSEGFIYQWRIWREPRVFFTHPGKGHWGSCWQFQAHDGYERVVEGNWLDLVPVVKSTAENYGLSLCSELS